MRKYICAAIVALLLIISIFFYFPKQREEIFPLLEVIIIAVAALFAWRASDAATQANILTQNFERPLPIILPPKGDFYFNGRSFNELPMFEIQNSGRSPVIILAMSRRWSAIVSESKMRVMGKDSVFEKQSLPPLEKTSFVDLKTVFIEIGPEYSSLKLPACKSATIDVKIDDESDFLICDGYILYSEALPEYKSTTSLEKIYQLGFIFHVPIKVGKSEFSMHLPDKAANHRYKEIVSDDARKELNKRFFANKD